MSGSKNLPRITFLLMLFFGGNSRAQMAEALLRGDSGQIVSLAESLAVVQPGGVVVIGENHGIRTHQLQQLQIMAELRRQGHVVAVGLEFLAHPHQQFLQAYRDGKLAETDFLKAVDWQSPSFAFYRDQALFPKSSENAKALAINAPRAITSQIAKLGLESLSAEQKLSLPPDFTLGRGSYKERFLSQMPHLPSKEAGDRYFAAQSAWDDTMAWQSLRYLDDHPSQTLVIIVGEFHVQYGGGLPDRLRARGARQVVTFSQIQTQGLSAQEIAQEIAVSPSFGPRAEFNWLTAIESTLLLLPPSELATEPKTP